MKPEKLIVFAMLCFGVFTANMSSEYTSVALAGEKIIIKGSTTVLPIAQKVSEAYMKENPDTKIELSGGGSGEGVKALMDSTTDIAMSSRDIKDKEKKMAQEKKVSPASHTIAYDSILPIVHPSNPITNITLAQLKDIYTGKVTNWKELGGSDSPIVMSSRDTSSGTFEVWEEKVMNKEKVTPKAQVSASSGAIVQAASSNKNAIGYVGLGYVNKNVKALKVNNIECSEKTTLDGTFPISRPLFMFTNGEPKGEVLKFINFLKDPEKGQKLVTEAGFVKLK